MPNAQVGTQLEVQRPPKFRNAISAGVGYLVVGGSWTEGDSLQDEEVLDENEETINDTFWNPGANASCTLVAMNGAPHPYKSQVITEDSPTADGEDPRSFLIMSVSKTKFGKRALTFAVTLKYRESQDLSQVS